MGDREDWRARGVLGLKALGAAVLLRHRHVQCKSIDNLGLDAEVNFKAATQSSKSRATGSPSHCSNKHCTAVEVGSGNRFRWRSYQSDCHKPLHPPPSYSLNPPPSEGATLCKHHLYGSVDVWGLFARMWAGVSTKIGKATLRDDIAGPTLHTNVLPKHRASLAKSWQRMTSQPNSRDRCRRSCLATLAAWIPRQVGRQVGIQVS